ncbi:MAG: hypothetical protein [Caudoviricetes sp.]|nr:MAG: hypothetical protein [Caudoviricetes sp.]
MYRLLLENTKNNKLLSIDIDRFSWEIFFCGWLIYPYIKYKLYYALWVYISLIISFAVISSISIYVNDPEVRNILHIVSTTLLLGMNILHSYWSAIGNRECMKYYITHGWVIKNNDKAAKLALMSIGLLP